MTCDSTSLNWSIFRTRQNLDLWDQTETRPKSHSKPRVYDSDQERVGREVGDSGARVCTGSVGFCDRELPS